ncbi:hypothetical protein ACFFMI_005874, partial [Klebsiella michiganensis]
YFREHEELSGNSRDCRGRLKIGFDTGLKKMKPIGKSFDTATFWTLKLQNHRSKSILTYF